MKISKTEKESILKKRLEDKKLLKKAKKRYVKTCKLNDPVKFVRYLLNATSISQRPLGALMGYESSGYIANVLSGKKIVTNKGAVNLANACDMNKGEKVEFYEGILIQKEGK